MHDVHPQIQSNCPAAISISQKFLNNIPNSIKELELIVPSKEILKFKKDSLKTGSSLIKEFLICES